MQNIGRTPAAITCPSDMKKEKETAVILLSKLSSKAFFRTG
jgi:hypothetical protein